MVQTEDSNFDRREGSYMERREAKSNLARRAF